LHGNDQVKDEFPRGARAVIGSFASHYLEKISTR
jgi:hypothetical protein